MRPSILDPLFAPLSSLPGIGPRYDKVLSRLLGLSEPAKIRDLLFHAPAGFVDRSLQVSIGDLPTDGGIVTLKATIEKHNIPPRGSRAPWRTTISDTTGQMTLVFFSARRDWLLESLPVGSERVISGALDWYNGRPQIAHPDYMVPPDRAAEIPLLDPAYPMTAGLTPKVLRRVIDSALERLPELDEWQEPSTLQQRKWPGFTEALLNLHRPEHGQYGASHLARQRLAYDELLASQIALLLLRNRLKRLAGRRWQITGRLQNLITIALPFELTQSQIAALGDILDDLGGPDRMLRLLQGDVGAGKTIVALLAMAAVAEAGGQAALMAPTDLLARQHYDTIGPIAEKAGLKTVLLSGKDRGKIAEAARAEIATGSANFAIGTHALFQAGVEFSDLGLVVVDEQHRFGVHQRLALSAKGQASDMLVMTATPIPRTLVLTYYGDMDVSKLTEKPAGRQPIDTRTIPGERVGDIIKRLSTAIAEGEKAYWICPLVEESEVLNAVSAEDRFAVLNQQFPGRAGLVHGRMTAADKDKVMSEFRTGDISILVATTVVEVGVDVPDATIMIIENAERFGLAQLHQLRGRVGRGERPSYCILLYYGPLGDTAAARLKIMRETQDGFRIAEEDLRLRGEGDLMGTRQSGLPGFRIANAEDHAELLEMARNEAKLILSGDPDFESPRAEALRLLLYIYGRDDAVRLMRSG